MRKNRFTTHPAGPFFGPGIRIAATGGLHPPGYGITVRSEKALPDDHSFAMMIPRGRTTCGTLSGHRVKRDRKKLSILIACGVPQGNLHRGSKPPSSFLPL
jgi:hypothetical protein